MAQAQKTRFLLSAKRTSPFKSAGASVQWTADSRGERISGSNAGYTVFRGSVKCTGYPLHSPVSPSLPLPCVTVCHHISTGVHTLSCLAFLALGTQHATQMRHIFICGPAGSTIFYHSYLIKIKFLEKRLLNIKCVKRFSTIFFWITLRKIGRCSVKNAYRPPSNLLVIYVRI